MIFVHRRDRLYGFTLAELLIALTLFALVVAMIGLPLLMGAGFIKRATARGESLRIGKQAIDRLEADLQNATQVYDLPPDGSSVAFLQSLPGEHGPSTVTFTRYARMLDYPWASNRTVAQIDSVTSATALVVDDAIALRAGMVVTIDNPTAADQTATIAAVDLVANSVTLTAATVPVQVGATLVEVWSLLDPAYMPSLSTSPYIVPCTSAYAPFHFSSGVSENPYVLTRYQSSLDWWDVAQVGTLRDVPAAFDPAYPLTKYDPYRLLAHRADARATLKRRASNDLASLTPRSDDWDVPHFTIAPMRVSTETLQRTARGQQTTSSSTLVSKYPLWAARNRDMDVATNAGLTALYGVARTQLDDGLRTSRWWPTWLPANAATMNDPARPLWWQFYPLGVNPFGYQVRIFDNDGTQVYGTTGQPDANGQYDMVVQRHFMDWPPIDRTGWDPNYPEWTPQEIAQQRQEGKLVFGQPNRPASLAVESFMVRFSNGATQPMAGCRLAIPSGNWSSATSVVGIPDTLVLKDSSNTLTLTFRAAGHHLPELFDSTQQHWYCLVEPSQLTPADERVIIFGGAMAVPASTETWTVENRTDAAFMYSDLQDDDIVQVTYATRAVLDVSLTTTRRSPDKRRPEDARNDYTVNRRIYARRAVQR